MSKVPLIGLAAASLEEMLYYCCDINDYKLEVLEEALSTAQGLVFELERIIQIKLDNKQEID